MACSAIIFSHIDLHFHGFSNDPSSLELKLETSERELMNCKTRIIDGAISRANTLQRRMIIGWRSISSNICKVWPFTGVNRCQRKNIVLLRPDLSLLALPSKDRCRGAKGANREFTYLESESTVASIITKYNLHEWLQEVSRFHKIN